MQTSSSVQAFNNDNHSRKAPSLRLTNLLLLLLLMGFVINLMLGFIPARRYETFFSTFK